MLADLEGLEKALNTELVELINKDYGDFVNLSGNLMSVKTTVAELREPLNALESEVLVRAYAYAHAYVCVCMYVCMYVCGPLYVDVCTCVHGHVYERVTCTYVCMSVRVWMLMHIGSFACLTFTIFHSSLTVPSHSHRM